MRIKFQPIPPTSKKELAADIKQFDIPYLLFLETIDFDEIPVIDYVQSYSDKCRYNLNIVKAWLPHVDRNLKVLKGNFCFIEIKTLFLIPFNFVLFRDTFVNYWDRDSDIHTIRPQIIVAGNEEKHLAITGFRSLASSFFRKIADKIDENANLTIIKKDDKIVLAFKVNHFDEKCIDYVVENFCNAIYELVKSTEFYGYYSIPDIDYKIKVNIAEQYKLNRKRKFMKRNKNWKIEKGY